jgi:ABC-2 type transport system permease protein
MSAAWQPIAVYTARRRRSAPLAWGGGLGALAAVVIAVFPSLRGNAQLDQLLDSYPEALKEAFGITEGWFSSVESYLAGEMFNLIAPLACCFFAIHAVSAAVGGTESRPVLEALLTAPITRRQYLAGVLVGVLAVLAGILFVLAVVMQLTSWVFGAGLAVGSTVAAIVTLWALAAFAGGAAAFLAGVSDRSVIVNGGAFGFMVAAYFAEVLGGLSDTVGAVDWLSPFHYYGTAITDGVDVAACAGLIAAGAIAAAAGCTLFERRDVTR